MSRVKPVFGVSDQVTSDTNWAVQPKKMDRSFGLGKYMDCTINVAKTKMLTSCVVTAKLICVFVFAYSKSTAQWGVARHIQTMSRILIWYL